MVPDLPLFVPVAVFRKWSWVPSAGFGHTLPGLVLFCLPVGLTLLGVFHWILKRPLLALMPPRHRVCLAPFAGRVSLNTAHWLGLVAVSLLIGALTHTVWDSLTHVYGWGVQRLDVLTTTVMEVGPHRLRIYTLLQHGGTVVGGALLVFWYANWFRKVAPAPSESPSGSSKAVRLAIVAAIGMCAFLGTLLFGVRGALSQSGLAALEAFAGQGSRAGVCCGATGVMVYAVCWHLIAWRHRGVGSVKPVPEGDVGL